MASRFWEGGPSEAARQPDGRPLGRGMASVVGLAALWICLQASGFYPLSLVPSIDGVSAQTVARMHLMYAAAVVACAIGIAVLGGRGRLPFQSPSGSSTLLPAMMGASGFVGHALLMSCRAGTAFFWAQMGIGSLLTGLFVAFAVYLWGGLSSHGISTQAIARVAVSYLVAQIVTAVYYSLCPSSTLLMLLCPLVCSVGAWLGGQAGLPSKEDAPSSSPTSLGGLRDVPWRMVAPALFLVYFGVVFVRLLVGPFNGDADVAGKAFTAFVCCAVFAVIVILIRRVPSAENGLTICLTVLVVLCMVSLVAMLLLDGHEHFYVRRMLVASEHCVEVFIWMALAYAVAAKRVVPAHAFGFYLVGVVAVPWVLSFDVFYLLGLDLVVQGDAILAPAVSIASLVAAFGLIIFLLSSLLQSRPTKRPEDSRWHPGLVEAILADAGLTPRELSVAMLVYRGYSARRIGEELGLAEQTVKTYTTRVYRKLGVHSKQDYIAHIERCASEREAG